MCGRYWIEADDAAEIADAARARTPEGAVMKRSGEIFPGDFVPVLAPDRRRRPSGFCMRWGYSGQRGLVFNARSETALSKPMFRDGMLERRCLAPLTRYFEWEKRGTRRVRHALTPRGGGRFYLAGLYRLEDRLPVFTVLTRAPVGDLARLHDRMPVLLRAEDAGAWLDPSGDPVRLLERAWLDVAIGEGDADSAPPPGGW